MRLDPRLAPCIEELLAASASSPDIAPVFSGYCAALARHCVPFWRATLGLEFLHPEVSGSMFIWRADGTEERDTPRPGILQSEAYRNSPTRVVDETNLTFRRRLDAPCPDMPLLEELRSAGASDYVMMPLPFIDQSRTANMSFASRAPSGFSERDLDILHQASKLFSPFAERIVLHRIAGDLLDTYVGPRTGRRILAGQIERGHFEATEAAMWFADLRGYTALSEATPVGGVVDILNAWFEAMGDAVDGHGGEILKFMGDGALAIFPTSERANIQQVCARALAAAEELAVRIDGLNQTRGWQLAFGLALHFGRVAYGNIGAPRRLDFTVIGPAVNATARLEPLTKALCRRIIASEAFRNALGAPMTHLGEHQLRGIEQPQNVFAPTAV